MVLFSAARNERRSAAKASRRRSRAMVIRRTLVATAMRRGSLCTTSNRTPELVTCGFADSITPATGVRPPIAPVNATTRTRRAEMVAEPVGSARIARDARSTLTWFPGIPMPAKSECWRGDRMQSRSQTEFPPPSGAAPAVPRWGLGQNYPSQGLSAQEKPNGLSLGVYSLHGHLEHLSTSHALQ